MFDYPYNLLDFEVQCSAVDVDIYFYNVEEGVPRKFKDNTFANLEPAPTLTQNSTGNDSYIKISYTINDGDANDISASGDGIIRDPIGLGIEVDTPETR